VSMSLNVQVAALQAAVDDQLPTSRRESANGVLLTKRQARLVELGLGVSTGDTLAIIGKGYCGHGLYVWLCDYIDEGPHFLGPVHQTLEERRVDIRGELLREVRRAIELGKRDPTGRLGLGAARLRAWQGIG
jgi:hypothetical protein